MGTDDQDRGMKLNLVQLNPRLYSVQYEGVGAFAEFGEEFGGWCLHFLPRYDSLPAAMKEEIRAELANYQPIQELVTIWKVTKRLLK